MNIKQMRSIIINTILDHIPYIGSLIRNIKQNQKDYQIKTKIDNISNNIEHINSEHDPFCFSDFNLNALYEVLNLIPKTSNQISSWGLPEVSISDNTKRLLITHGATTHSCIGGEKWIQIPPESFYLGMMCCCGDRENARTLCRQIDNVCTTTNQHNTRANVAEIIERNGRCVRPYIKEYIKSNHSYVILSNEITNIPYTPNEYTICEE